MPEIDTQTITFDVHDAKIAPLLTDTKGAAKPTYGPWLDVPGIQQVQANPTFINAELKGDARILDNRARTTGFDVTANYALLDLEVIAALLGGSVINTDGEVSEWALSGENSVPYVRFAFAVNDLSTGLGSLIVCLNKAKLTGGNLFDQQTDQYGTRSMQLQGIPPLSNDQISRVILSKDATDIETLLTNA